MQSSILLAQDKITTDSLRHTTAPPITVTSDAYNNKIAIHPADIHTVTAEQLQVETGATRLSDALRVLHPSLDIRNYGSLGGISLASFRGLPAEYTSVYWEGICITDPQHSFTDLGLIDLKSVQSVGIISAANSQLIGGDVGGAGILLTTNPSARPTGFDIGTSLLSYNDLSSMGEKQLDLSGIAIIGDKLSFGGGINTTYSDGAFPFLQNVDNKFVTVIRENNDAHLLNANLSANYLIDTTATVKAFSYFTRSERGAPAQVTTDFRGASAFAARQYDENFLSALSLSHQPLTNYEYTLSIGYQSQYETYTDHAKIPPTADRYLNRIYSVVWKSKTTFADWTQLYGGVDYTRDLLFSNANSLNSGDTEISRNHYAAYTAEKIEFLNNFDATVSLRTELLSDIPKPQILPAISLHFVEPHTLLSLQVSYGSLYHAPTFNELYWKVGGNANLLPESGTNAEASFDLPISFNKNISFAFHGGFFQMLLKNQIVWLERADGIYSPSNVQSSRSQGFEFTGEMQYAFSPQFQLSVREGLSLYSAKNLTTKDSLYGKELPYSTPMRSVFQLGLRNITFGNLSFLIIYRGHRFTDYYNSTKLPPVITYDLTFSSAQIIITNAISAALGISLLNLTNKQYEEIPSFPQPGRSIRASINFHFL